MIHYKSLQEIQAMQEGGAILREVVKEILPRVKPGITTLQIDAWAQEEIKKRGADISFNKVKDYFWAICACVNEQLVHTPPSGYVLKEGDVLTIDIGVFHKGFHTDFATTFVVGENHDPKIKLLLETGKKTLEKALRVAKAGNYIGDISEVLQTGIESAGFSIVKQLTGHGVGRDLHEEPYVPCFVSKPRTQTPLLKPGMTLAIEVMYSMGNGEMAHEPGSDWSIITADRSLSAQFEHSLAITDKNTLILT